jgi:hypothetical protein
MPWPGPGWSRAALGLTIWISLSLAACVHVEKQSTVPTLVTAERRLVKAEKQSLDIPGQSGEFLAVAKIAEQQLSSSTESEAAKSSALALYNRATADLAADVPALIQKEKTAGTISLKDSQSGQTNQLQLESGKRGEYPPTYFQQILVAARVDRKGMRDWAARSWEFTAVQALGRSRLAWNR